MRVLVTGGNGFLGRAIVRALHGRGDYVVSCDVQPAPAGGPAVSSVAGDIADAGHVMRAVQEARPDAVIHCAAIVGVVPSVSSPRDVVRVNIEGSINVFEAMREAGVRRCIHISSEEAYGAFRSARIDETHALDPVLPYGICKAAVEQLGRTYRDLHGLEIVNLRPSWIYGPGLPRDRIPRNLVHAALAGRRLHIPSGADAAIDHTYMEDVVAAVLAALDHPRHRHDAYNVGSGTAVTVAELADIVRQLVPGAALSVGPGPYRYGDRVTIVQKGALDVSRAAAEFGWRPRFDIRAGLAAYVEALRTKHASEIQ